MRGGGGGGDLRLESSISFTQTTCTCLHDCIIYLGNVALFLQSQNVLWSPDAIVHISSSVIYIIM